LDWPHSNLASVLAETGILGFVPYVMTHILLLWAIWQLRRLPSYGWLVLRYQVYMFLTYWITGLTESTGLEPFVNLWYVFVITVCYKYGLTAPDAILPAEMQAPDGAFSAPARIF
jgi:O-antigen ligase